MRSTPSTRRRLLLGMILLLGLSCPAYARRGGWAHDPQVRRKEILAVATVLAVVVFAYGANRILNAPPRIEPHELQEESNPPEAVD